MGFLDMGDRKEPLTTWEPILQVSPGKPKPHELKRFPPCDWNPAQNQLLNLTQEKGCLITFPCFRGSEKLCRYQKGNHAELYRHFFFLTIISTWIFL